MQDQIITQLIGISPSEFKEDIVKDVIAELKAITKKFHPQKPDEYLTRRDAAKLFKVSLVTISKWSKKGGILKPYRLGKFIRFKRVELEQALIQINHKHNRL
jgi:excisionase family DNA binding protein